MDFTAKLYSGKITGTKYHVLVVPIFEDRKLHPELKEIDKAWKNELTEAVKDEALTSLGELYIAPTPLAKGLKRVAFVGMGKRNECDLETVRRAAGLAANSLRKREIPIVTFLAEAFVPPEGDVESTCRALIEGARLGSYTFDQFKTEKETNVISTAEIHLPGNAKIRDYVPMLNEVTTLTTSSIITRDWCNTPANLATPTHLSRLAKDIAKEASLSVKILDEKACDKLGMGAFLGVSKGSNEPPQFIILDYKPTKYTKTIVMVGKAITFDSGGISLKPGKDMHIMKGDKGGGVAVLATMRAVGLLKPKKVRVVGIIPACENMPSGHATKPGDIIRTMSGKSIEVLNTDAEGRLIMADGLEYGRIEYNPDYMIDVATLTGACVIALGEQIAGYWTDFDILADAMNAAGEVTGEKVWRMPLEMEYDDQLKSQCADTQNIGKREGGAITAALFLKKFVGDIQWLHLDIAGPFWSNENRPYTPKGCTGYGPRLLYNFVAKLAE